MPRFLGWATTALLGVAPPCARTQQAHPFDVKDDIAMVRFSGPLAQSTLPVSEATGMSPDHRYVALVTSKGVLEQDAIQSQLWLFTVGEIASALANAGTAMPKPRLIASIVSYPHREQITPYAAVIKNVRWSKDSKTVYFLRENEQGASQLCAVEVGNGRLQVLSAPQENVNLFDISGDTALYTSSLPSTIDSLSNQRINPDAVDATGLPIFEILFPDAVIQGAAETWNLTVARRKNHRWITRKVPGFSLHDRSLLSSLVPFVLSPDGQSVVTLLPVLGIPSAWELYEPAPGMEHLHFRGGDADVLDARNGNRPQQYVRIDLRTGQQTAMLAAPDGRSLGYTQPRLVIWSGDGKRVLITNTFFPSGVANATDIHPCLIASVDVQDGKTRCLSWAAASEAPSSFGAIRFGRSDNEVTVVRKPAPDRTECRTYRFQSDQWQRVPARELQRDWSVTCTDDTSQVPVENIQLLVRQSLNDPPTLWAENIRSGKSGQVWDPNPQFKAIRFAEAVPYDWTDHASTKWEGQLVKPLDYVAGKRYPLVVQLYTINRGQFITGGPYPTAFAARELASVGFFVLLVQKKPDTLTEQDPIIHLRAYRSAVEKLSRDGFVDRKRVGVVGFSWTCWYAADVLVRDPGLFAVATIADGLDDSYMQYHFAADVQPIQRQMEHIRGSGPFGDGLKRWFDESSGFHLDQVRAPLRIEAINPASVLQEWELYSSLRMQNKPVDLIYFPSGTHIHQKPLERLESQQGNVDWFRFWLQNYEDPSPAKRKQYVRWEKLRETAQP